jgi:capsular polysaccharide export protein
LRELFFQAEQAPLIATARALANLPRLGELLGAPVVHRWTVRDAAACAGVIAWGRKPSAVAAEAYADRQGLALLRIEDGFLRSMHMGASPLSVVVDDLGIYYDASAPSRLEMLIAHPLVEAQRIRAQALIAAWRAARVSKYNHAREYAGELPACYVLVADQTQGDASIRHGFADASSFQHMLAAALAENPDCIVLLKTHPEVMAGRKRGYFDLAALAQDRRVRVLAEDAHPASLIEHAEAVYAVTSQIGFEGLLRGKRVRCFGMPFYAGWGLTQDELPAPDRRHPVQVENLAHAALLEYPRYIDPETGRRCEAERVIEWMGLQRRMRERFSAHIYALGFSIYKRPIVRRFFQGSTVRFIRKADAVPQGATLAVWGRNEHASIHATEAKIIRLEDGFIRSVGLGADLVRPLSWVMDGCGIYYDAAKPSGLEYLLQTACFDAALLGRARALRERLVAEGLSKYNVGTTRWQRPQFHPSSGVAGTRVILVPGQVESDASLSYGASGIRRNLDLLRSVRAANPEAHLIYKPHPDVVAGLRRKGVCEEDAARCCDEMVADVPMGELLPQVDEVHTLTSLTGFEALLRGKRVVCYGQPFYAGWGLTEDMLPLARRTLCLSLDELVAGVLILYPVYVSRKTGNFTTPEQALDELLAWRKQHAAGLSWWRKGMRQVLRLMAN